MLTILAITIIVSLLWSPCCEPPLVFLIQTQTFLEPDRENFEAKSGGFVTNVKMVGLVGWFNLDIIQWICYHVSATKVKMVGSSSNIEKAQIFVVTNVSRLMLRWVSPAIFKAGSLLARVTPFVVIPIVCKQLVPIFTSMSDINKWQIFWIIWESLEKVFTWSPGRAASLSTMETTSPLTRGSPPVNRIWKLKFLNNLTF